MSKTYSGNASDLKAAGYPAGTRFVRAGYMEAPLKGQWYLSGAQPAAYRAPNNLTQVHVIAYPVRPASTPGYAPRLIAP